MCVIINIEDGKYPEYKTLKDAESLNSHGGSIAWLENGKINYHKGINAKKINQYINKKLKPNNVKTAIIHFRIASVGKINSKLCHPFPISNKVETKLKVFNSDHDLLFHNGTIDNWKDILIESIQGKMALLPKGELSDSRVMAYIINEYGHDFLKNVVSGNRFSILTKDGIKKYGQWVKIGVNECSNDYFVKSNFYDNFEINKMEVNKMENELNDEINRYVKTKNDFKYYEKIIKEYGHDYEVLDLLDMGYTFEEIYNHFFELSINNYNEWY